MPRGEPSAKRIAVKDLKPLAGLRVRFVGEQVDPYRVKEGTVDLPAWETSYIKFGASSFSPSKNEYFSFSDSLDAEPEELAGRIRDLSAVCLIMTHDDMELGLAVTDAALENYEWSIAEAFTRLGMLPPATQLRLPSSWDFPRGRKRRKYLIAAFREGINREIRDYGQRFSRTLQILDEKESLL